jgi:hypothetical protein
MLKPSLRKKPSNINLKSKMRSRNSKKLMKRFAKKRPFAKQRNLKGSRNKNKRISISSLNDNKESNKKLIRKNKG